MKSFTLQDIRDASENRILIISCGYVYDVTSFINRHPGGHFVLRSNNRKNVTKYFHFHPPHAQKLWAKYKIGILKTSNTCMII